MTQTESMHRYLRVISRKGKIDSLLLFAASLISLIFSITQWLMEGFEALLYILPLMLIMLVMPLYVGYIRGAITKDNVVERARGWTYLVVGVITYLVWILSLWLSEFVARWLLPLIALIILAFSFLFARHFSLFIFDVMRNVITKEEMTSLQRFRDYVRQVEEERRRKEKEAVKITGIAATLLGAALVLVCFSLQFSFRVSNNALCLSFI